MKSPNLFILHGLTVANDVGKESCSFRKTVRDFAYKQIRGYTIYTDISVNLNIKIVFKANFKVSLTP